MAETRRKSILIIHLLVISFFYSPSVWSQWGQTNGPEGATVHSFLVNDSRLFAGTDNGIFASQNEGETWEALLSFPPNISVISLLSHRNILFAGGYYKGIFRSTDEGNTWLPSSSGLSLTDGALNVSSFLAKGSTLFAGTESAIYVSNNDGTSWDIGDNSARMRAIRTFTAVGDTLVAGTFGQGVFRSTDGIRWVVSNNGLSQVGLYISSLLTIDNTLIAGVGDVHNSGRHIYRSTDFGMSWWPSDSGLPEPMGVFSLLQDEEIVFAGTTRGTFVSHDLGKSWHTLTDELSPVVARALAVKRGYLFAGTQQTGVYRTSFIERQWEPASHGLVTTSVGSLLSLGDTVLAGSRSSGVFQSVDAGKSWLQIGLDRSNVSTLLLQGSSVYALAGAMVRSTDRGLSWRPIPSDFLPYFPPTIYSFAVSDSFLYAGVFHWDGHSSWSWLYRKSHSDSAWNHLSYFWSMSTISSIATVGNDVFLIVEKYSQDGGFLYHSTDHGNSWEVNDLSVVQVYTIYAHKNLVLAGTSSGVYRSADRGTTWSLSYEGLPQGIVTTAFTMKDNIVFVGTATSGVFFSTNEGQRWNKLGTNPVAQGHSIKSLTANSEYLFAGTDGRGIWSIPLDKTTSIKYPTDTNVPTSFTLNQNYPNPFNPTTTISYDLPRRSAVYLKIFNVLGEEVVTLVNGEVEAGRHRVQWEARGLPSGVYLYQLRAGNLVETKKLILAR